MYVKKKTKMTVQKKSKNQSAAKGW